MKSYSATSDLQFLSETALESSLAGYWDWDMVTNEEYLSTRFKEMFGYEDHEMENSPESWQKIAFQEDLPTMFAAFEKHVKSGGTEPFKSVVRFHHKDGSTVWVRCNGKIVDWGVNGEPLRAIGCHVDITEEKRMEEELKKAVAERDLLLLEVHHRVKNSLQLILSLAKLKDKNGLVEMREIEDSISCISNAYEAIYRSDNLSKISIKDYLQQVVTPIIRSKNAKHTLKADHFEYEIDFLIPIGLVITELTNNSMKYGKEDSSQMEISIDVSKNNNYLSIIYRDNGKGYGDLLNTIKTTNSFGLTIIQALLRQLKGSIEFYDDNGACAKLQINVVGK